MGNDILQTLVFFFSHQIDLQTTSQRLMLSGADVPATDELGPDQSIDDVIHHEVKELGTHM